MKIMIDISEEVKKHCDMQGTMIQTIDIVAMRKAIKSGILIPDNATNGDVIKALFPKATYFNEDSSCATMKVNMGELDEYVDFYTDWWNAPYKGNEQ